MKNKYWVHGSANHFSKVGLPLMAQLVKNLPAMWETWAGKIPWRRERLPTPVYWPGEFHGLYSLWCHKELDPTEWLSLTHSLHIIKHFHTGYLTYMSLPVNVVQWKEPRTWNWREFKSQLWLITAAWFWASWSAFLSHFLNHLDSMRWTI